MSNADEESRRMATLSTRNNLGAASSSSSSTSTALRVVASTLTEPTLNMPTTPAQLTEMIASAVATALTSQQPLNRDLFNSSNSGSSSIASIGTEIEILEGPNIRPVIQEVPTNLYRQTSLVVLSPSPSTLRVRCFWGCSIPSSCVAHGLLQRCRLPMPWSQSLVATWYDRLMFDHLDLQNLSDICIASLCVTSDGARWRIEHGDLLHAKSMTEPSGRVRKNKPC